ncbi:phosphodiester glycosidase family protein [Candidatus Gottesmanbacteria bacterium]|nr:phosphodiester glycosidase family protein [Candidatus Gottesmanbacteria bacterium]
MKQVLEFLNIPKFRLSVQAMFGIAGFFILFVSTTFLAFNFRNESQNLSSKLSATEKELKKVVNELEVLKKEDQYVKNKALEEEIKNINTAYLEAVSLYEQLIDLAGNQAKTATLEAMLSDSLTYLAKRNYASGTAELKILKAEIQKTKATVASTFTIPKNVPVENAPPSSGYRRQTVQIDIGQYLVDIITGDLNSTRVIVDTASDSTCGNDCPVDSLASYAGRSGAYAGINGPYFCPAEYPSCSDKKNSFDTLLMNKNKVYFNSDNNVYSNVPAVIFSGNSARFVGASSEWGRDTGVDSVIAAQPMLLSGGNITFGGDGDPKKGSKGNRSFIGVTGNTVYIGVVHNATVAEVAHVLKALGIQSALNLDSGGSTALWFSGRYIAGPGRNTPYGILFARK